MLEIALKSLGAESPSQDPEAPPSPAPRRAAIQSGYLPAEYPMLWPRPQAVTEKKGAKAWLPVQPMVNIVLNKESGQGVTRQLWRLLAKDLKAAGLTPRLVQGEASRSTADILLQANPVLWTRPEGYRLMVREGRTVLLAHDVAGLRHGARTLRQLLQCYGTRHEPEQVACQLT